MRTVVLSILLMGLAQQAFACSVCFGDPNSPLTNGLNYGIMTLLIVIGTVLGVFAVMFLNIRRRCKKKDL